MKFMATIKLICSY